MDILFLDVDGTLNNLKYLSGHKDDVNTDKYPVQEVVDKQLDPKNVKNLEKILEETECNVVLHSSWRKFVKMNQLVEGLNKNGMDKKHNDRFISKTPVLGSKAEEINEWLKKWDGEKVNKYLVLDDSANKYDDLKSFGDKWVKTKTKKGLTKKKAQKVINKFKGLDQAVGSIENHSAEVTDLNQNTQEKPIEIVNIIS